MTQRTHRCRGSGLDEQDGVGQEEEERIDQPRQDLVLTRIVLLALYIMMCYCRSTPGHFFISTVHNVLLYICWFSSPRPLAEDTALMPVSKVCKEVEQEKEVLIVLMQEIEASLEQFRMARGRRQLGNRLQDILARYLCLSFLKSPLLLYS